MHTDTQEDKMNSISINAHNTSGFTIKGIETSPSGATWRTIKIYSADGRIAEITMFADNAVSLREIKENDNA